MERIYNVKNMSEAKQLAVDIIKTNISLEHSKTFDDLENDGYVLQSNKDNFIDATIELFIKKVIKNKKELKNRKKRKGKNVYWKIVEKDGDVAIDYVDDDLTDPEVKKKDIKDFIKSGIYRHGSKRYETYLIPIKNEFLNNKYVVIVNGVVEPNHLSIPQNISLICVGNGERVETEESDSPEKNEKVEKSNSVTFGRNILLYGAPGTGKSHTAQQIVKNNAKDDKTCKELKLDNMSAGKSVRVTFHPDTDYASFVGCYKPSMNDKEEIVYKFVPQAFLKIYVDAWKNLISDEKTDEKKQYYLVIEELNRGNCAQIFGDIFQLLDRNDEGYSDYYIWADTDVVKYLKSEEGFGNDYEKYCKKLENIFKELKDADKKDWGVLALPSNLTILATMNTSDQSLFPIDSAFKRRWEWKYVRINYDAVDLKDVKLWNGTTKWLDFIEAINKYIADKTHSADKQIGERFVKPINGKIDYATFRDKVMFYLFNDVFKDDVEFGREVSGGASANEVFLFENLFEFEKTGKSKIENFIAKLL